MRKRKWASGKRKWVKPPLIKSNNICRLGYQPIDKAYRNLQSSFIENNLSKEEKEAFYFYRGKGYRTMNEHVRQGIPDSPSFFLQSAIQKAPAIPETISLYLGLALVQNMVEFEDFWRHMKVGSLYKALGFHSFSQDPVHANHFANPWGSVIVVQIPAGSRLLYNQEEKEWIAPHGSLYRYDGHITCGCQKKKPPVVGAVELDLNLGCKNNQPRKLFKFTLFTNPNSKPPSNNRSRKSSITAFARLHPPTSR